MSSIKNIDDLVQKMTSTYDQLESGSIQRGEAAERANLVGKVIAAHKLQLAYYIARKERPDMVFLDSRTRPAFTGHGLTTIDV